MVIDGISIIGMWVLIGMVKILVTPDPAEKAEKETRKKIKKYMKEYRRAHK